MGLFLNDDVSGPMWTVPVALVNLNQELAFNTISTKLVPRLLRGSLLWDMVRSRPLMPEELWLIQCWPVSDMVSKAVSLDFLHDLSVLGDVDHRVLMGNAQNLAGIGAVAFWAMGTIVRGF